MPPQLAAAEGACEAEVVVHPTAGHGGFLVDHPFQRRLARRIASLAAAADGKR